MQDRKPARRTASALKRRVMNGKKFFIWVCQDFMANPRFALYSRRLGRQNYAFFFDLKARGAEARQDWLAPVDIPDMPRIIWIYWHQGEAEAPFIVRRCIETWRSRNPGWEVRVLCAQTVRDYVDMSDVPPGLPLRYSANLLRVRLMRDYGGVWTDATIYCHRPLDEWIWLHLTGGFFVFHNGGPDRFIESWFIASVPRHLLSRHWAEDFARHLQQLPKVSEFYFIFFYVFQWRILKDLEAQAAFARISGLSALPAFVMIEALRGVLPKDQLIRLLSAGLPLSKLSWRGELDQAAFDRYCADLDRLAMGGKPSKAAHNK